MFNNKEQEHRCSQRYGSHLQLIARLPHKESVCHIVNQYDQHTDDGRNGVFQNDLRNGTGFKIIDTAHIGLQGLEWVRQEKFLNLYPFKT